MKSEDLYKTEISKILNADPSGIILYWKGRVALYALLKAAGVTTGDEVLLSGLTCVVVPNAIKYLGARPVYVDVGQATYNPSVSGYYEKLSSKTKVILIQNTFGLSSDVEEIKKLAEDHGILTFEDCTHGFGGYYNGKPNGCFSDAAVFSTQWNKPYSTGIGGFCSINNSGLYEKIKNVNDGLIKTSFADNFMLAAQIWANDNVLNNWSYWTLRDLYRRLSRAGLAIGSSQGTELKSPEMPEGFFKGVSSVQINKGLRNIRNLKDNLRLRKQNAVIYSDFLKFNNKNYVHEPLWDNHSFLIYPILVKDRSHFLNEAEKHKIRIGDWFVSPLHPVTEDLHLWDFNEKNLPTASYLSKHLINLPTTLNEITGVLDFLNVNIDNII